MLTTGSLTSGESVSLSKEIAVIGVQSTPFSSLLLQNGKIEKANGAIHSWRERTLDDTEDISAAEGSETEVFYESARAELSNPLEIFKKGVSVSGTINAISVNGVGNVFAGEVADRLLEVKVNLENKLINGVRDDGSVSGIRKMDGILEFVDEGNVVNGSTLNVITEAELKATVKKLWDVGLPSGNYFGLVNADIKEQIDELYKDKYTYLAQENMFGIVVDVVKTNYGNLNLVLSRHVPADKLIVFDLDFLTIAFLREPLFEALAKTGDSIKGHVLTEATLKVGSKKAIATYTLKTS